MISEDNEITKAALHKTNGIVNYVYENIKCYIFNRLGIEIILIELTFGMKYLLKMSNLLLELNVEKAFILSKATSISSDLQLNDVLISQSVYRVEYGKNIGDGIHEIYKSVSLLELPQTITHPNTERKIVFGDLAVTAAAISTDILQVNRKIKAINLLNTGLFELLTITGINNWLTISIIADYGYDAKNSLFININNLFVVFDNIMQHYSENLQINRTYFICSTCYDLGDLRAELAHFLAKKQKNVLWSESIDFPVDFTIHSHDVCLDNIQKADHIIVIIDRRYGGIYAGSKYPKMEISITQYELEIALSLNKPITTFVRSNVWSERATYKKNAKYGIDIKTAHVDSSKVFEFIDFINRSGQNWIYQFNNSVDLRLQLEKILNM